MFCLPCSSTNSLHGEEEDDTVTSEQDGGVADDQSNSLFNCHSFMDKTPTARWSKQDTELFYEVPMDLILHFIYLIYILLVSYALCCDV